MENEKGLEAELKDSTIKIMLDGSEMAYITDSDIIVEWLKKQIAEREMNYRGIRISRGLKHFYSLKRKFEEQSSLELISCTLAGKILNLSKKQVKQLIEEKKLRNYGDSNQYMVSKIEVNNYKNSLAK